MKFFSYDDPDERLSDDATVALRPALRDFSEAQLDALHSFVAELRFAPGARVVAIGEHSPTLFIIVSGSVRIAAHQAGNAGRAGLVLGEGEVFGISSFLDGEASAISAEACEGCEVLALRRASFDQLAAWQPALAIALLHDLATYASRRLRVLNAAC
ncbi:MAG TPA: cyclic nucleotide-binding domain-containing protein [Accumulibacter sp.]|uniref:Crp/Fnr family transcriptional regulator n=1 Tax=Accumulibacter sp. TaxID=2053492 RepID=UPI0026218977|nr:cyclic nucleotide-binding domain-containing protein [Accumulibacter sp.]MDS4056745.1 cyclic nucleotide-binding domain-containing protein [Accumulibacter sp.]HMW80910.1 cyclic nucleotide-binding domain-containing protein [Accumulibacter sp.]HNB68479.1 cyclic nucleotide-binding domain-containing protein [Accumulibacter sp.]HNC27798.1 cyclic nucleotide-binding domain-containing protein [Accumulibacter sp.]HND40582.1 cyclic nucleotide-binding domain-containing protein [Accumulibacter sp.]